MTPVPQLSLRRREDDTEQFLHQPRESGSSTEILHSPERLVVWFDTTHEIQLVRKLDVDHDSPLFTHKTAEYTSPFIWMQCLHSPPCTYSQLDTFCPTRLLILPHRAKSQLRRLTK